MERGPSQKSQLLGVCVRVLTHVRVISQADSQTLTKRYGAKNSKRRPGANIQSTYALG